MLRKIAALLAVVLCIGMMAACSLSESDTSAVDVNTEILIPSNTESNSIESTVIPTASDTDSEPTEPADSTLQPMVPEPITSPADSNSPPTNISELEPIGNISNALCYSANIEYADSANWLEHIYGDIDVTYFYSSDKVGIICDFEPEWTYENSFYADRDGHTALTHHLYLAQLLCVPKGSFTRETDGSDLIGIWLSENILKVHKDDAILYYIKTSNDNDKHDYIACFSLDSIHELQYTDKLLMSANIMQTTHYIMNNDDVTIYQYKNDTLIIAPANGNAWILNSYPSDFDYQAFNYQDGKVTIRIFQGANFYEVLIDPISKAVIDTHTSEAEVTNFLGQNKDYISCTYHQYVNGKTGYYLYSDRMVYCTISNGEKYEKVTMLLHSTKPTDRALEEFYEKIVRAIIYMDPNSLSYKNYYELGAESVRYHIAEKSPFCTYNSYKYYLSCLFTKESVDYLLSWKNKYGYEYITQSENGLLYFACTLERGDLVPDMEDGYWKCNLLA